MWPLADTVTHCSMSNLAACRQQANHHVGDLHSSKSAPYLFHSGFDTKQILQHHDWFNDLLTFGLCCGLIISYLPQHYRIIHAKSSEGFSPVFLLLGTTSAASTLFNMWFVTFWKITQPVSLTHLVVFSFIYIGSLCKPKSWNAVASWLVYILFFLDGAFSE